jgi:hypothetical protein
VIIVIYEFYFGNSTSFISSINGALVSEAFWFGFLANVVGTAAFFVNTISFLSYTGARWIRLAAMLRVPIFEVDGDSTKNSKKF